MADKKRNPILLTRREWLRMMGAAGTVAGLAACAPPAAPAAEEGAAEVLVDRWTTGLVDPDISGTFRIISWEGEGEIDKFIPYIEGFFEERYPNMEVEIDMTDRCPFFVRPYHVKEEDKALID